MKGVTESGYPQSATVLRSVSEVPRKVEQGHVSKGGRNRDPKVAEETGRRRGYRS
jgi:hypothetical protein